MRNFKPPRNDFGQINIYFFAVVFKGVRQIYCPDRNTSIPFGFPNILRNFHKMNSSSETGKKEWKIVSHDLAWLTNSCLSQVLRDWISVYVITSTFFMNFLSWSCDDRIISGLASPINFVTCFFSHNSVETVDRKYKDPSLP